ncbi:MAG: hypothetical protein ACLUR5_17345 [Eubacterium ventriosum]
MTKLRSGAGGFDFNGADFSDILVDLEIYLVTYLVAEAEEAQEPTMVQ